MKLAPLLPASVFNLQTGFVTILAKLFLSKPVRTKKKIATLGLF
jgi:hypothetical protein